MVFVLVPGGDLFDAGLFEVVRERGLAGAWRGAGEDVAAGVGDAGGGWLSVEGGEGRGLERAREVGDESFMSGVRGWPAAPETGALRSGIAWVGRHIRRRGLARACRLESLRYGRSGDLRYRRHR